MFGGLLQQLMPFMQQAGGQGGGALGGLMPGGGTQPSPQGGGPSTPTQAAPERPSLGPVPQLGSLNDRSDFGQGGPTPSQRVAQGFSDLANTFRPAAGSPGAANFVDFSPMARASQQLQWPQAQPQRPSQPQQQAAPNSLAAMLLQAMSKNGFTFPGR